MDAKHEEIIRKVQKLFRLAEKAGTDAEAQAAAMRAREIMAQYNINLADAQNFTDEDCHEEEIIIKANYLPRHYLMLIIAMEKLFGVEALISKKLVLTKEKYLWRKTISFIGVGADAIVACQTCDFLMEYAKRRAREMRLTGVRKTDFLYGFALSISDRAADEQKKAAEVPQENALVPVKKGAIDAYITRKYQKVEVQKGRHVHSFTEYTQHGYEVGKRAPLDRPVEGSVRSGHVALN